MASRTTATEPPYAETVLPAPGRYLCGLTWDGEHLWHSDQEALRIYAVDSKTGAVVRDFECKWVRADMTFDGSMLCQVGGRPKRLVLVDRDTGKTSGQVEVPPASGRLTGADLGPEGMWMLFRGPMVVQLRDYPAMNVLREYPVPGSSPSGLTYADGTIVYGEFEPGLLHAVDAATGEHLGSAAVAGRPTGLTGDGERVWYCDFPNGSLRTFDLAELLR